MNELPTELTVHIFHYIDLRSLVRCRQVCRTWNEAIQCDLGLLYKQELAVAGLEDGNSETDVAERLRLLRKHQEAWDNLEFTDDFVIDMHPHPFLSWELQGGVLSQQTTMRSISFRQIPSKVRGIAKKEWSIADLDIMFVDFGLDPSQDLLVLAEGSDLNNPDAHHIHLRTLTNGVRHPLASNSVLQYESKHPHYDHNIRISGDYLAICWEDCLLVVWEWKSGEIRLAMTGPLLTFAFLPNNFILIPRQDEVDIIAIDLTQAAVNGAPYSPEIDTAVSVSDLYYHCAFGLPPLAPGYKINDLEMRYDPQPSCHPTESPPVPFRTTHDGDNLIVLYVTIVKDGSSTLPRFFIRTTSIMQRLVATPAYSKDAKLPWHTWGPSSCWVDPSNRDNPGTWPRNVFGTKYVELQFKRIGFPEPSAVVFADFNQLKYRKSMTTSDSEEACSSDVGGFAPPFREPVITSLSWREKRLSLKREAMEPHRAALVCEDAIVIPQPSPDYTIQFRVMSI
ncbi:hypothetical protein QCA50_003987 [Cerrena zonata]|uniref:F-box domain-containing protein n=1 Tax=Cerrena zonata TaxID=2478898 RepID=A0AAW0GI50_9APHY